MLYQKHHRTALYGLVFLLVVLQITSFVMFSSRITKTQSELEATRANLTQTFMQALENYNTQNQQSFSELAQELRSQKETQSSFLEEITVLKSSAGDFSAVVEDAVKGVVSVGTDKGTGSGFIVDSQGYIVTNYHVIADAKKIAVLTYTRDVVPAELLGADKDRDLAVLKISGTHHALPLGDSDSLQVGRKVIAIGNPFGLSFTVTEGIVSALDREGPNGQLDYIQTDVSLNPGNSGGPLIDTSGRVIGINNFKVGNAESLGFALEINAAKDVINHLANATIVS
ncbi:trypsin-like peptidase domain-containing protein [Candidatus Pacearchaeota archaeon]|nr:trypsin-like peptidase domain-containing protein [Candidatus Pacearchaeota archaeon]